MRGGVAALLLLLCANYFATCNSETLVAEKATYEIKTVSSFGLDVTYAEHTIEFNKDIAFTVPVICPNYDCSDQDAIDTTCLCNYASKDPKVCGIIDSSCPNYPCPDYGLCNDTATHGDWVELKANELGEFVIDDPATPNVFVEGGSKNYQARFFLDNKCSGFKINLERLSGIVHVTLYNPEYPYENYLSPMDWWGDNSEIAFSQHICPDDPVFELGTWFITYYLGGTQQPSGSAKFNLGFEAFSVAQGVVSPSCTQVDVNVPCLTPDLETVATVNDPYSVLFFSYTHEGPCTVVGARVSPNTLAPVSYYYFFGAIGQKPGGLTGTPNDFYFDLYNGVDRMFVVEMCSNDTLYLRYDDQTGQTYDIQVVVTFNHTNWEYRALSSYSVYDGYMSFQSSSIYYPFGTNNDTRYDCNSLVTQCYGFFTPSQTAPTLFYPHSRVISEEIEDLLSWGIFDRGIVRFENYINAATMVAYPNPPNAKQLKFIVVISTTTSYSARSFTEESTLKYGALKLTGAFRGANGEFLPSEVSGFTKVDSSAKCDLDHYNTMHAYAQELLDQLADTELLAKNPAETWINVYSLTILRNSDGWRSCSNYLDSLVTSKVSTIEADIIQCQIPWTDPAYVDDPCCSNVKAWETPCVPTPGTVEVASYSLTDANSNAVMNQCATGTCINSFLSDFVSTKNHGGACKDDTRTFQTSFFDTIELQRNCRAQFFGSRIVDAHNHGKGVPCSQDSDCPGSGCNFYFRVCQTTYTAQLDGYIQCLLNNMTQGQRDYIAASHNVSLSDANIIDKLKADWRYGDLDCAFNEDLSGVYPEYGIGYLYTSGWNQDLFVPFDWASPMPYSSDWVLNKLTDPEFLTVSYSCEHGTICNVDDGLCGTNLTACQEACGEGVNACLLCHDSLHCELFDEFDTQNSCESAHVCVTPYPKGSGENYDTTLTKAQCDNQTVCTSYNPKCTSYAFGFEYKCVDVMINQTYCETLGGTYLPTINAYPIAYSEYCQFDSAHSASACSAISATAVYQSCSSLSNGVCTDCWNYLDCPLLYDVFYCYVDPFNPAETQQDCETNAGSCAGEEAFKALGQDSFGFTTYVVWGTCWTPPVYYDTDLVAVCDQNYMKPFQDKCLWDYQTIVNDFGIYLNNEGLCNDFGGFWLPASEDKETCESWKGCLELSPNRYIAQTANTLWSAKNESQCAEVTLGKYGSYSTWEAGSWIKSTYKPLSWTPKHANTIAVLTNEAVNYQLIYADLFLGTSFAASVEGRAAQLCDFAVSNTITTAVVCDCLGGENCFNSTLVPTDVVQACYGSSSTGTTSSATVTFSASSVSQGQCSVVSLAPVSAELFKAEPVITLSSAFAKFKKVTAYAVQNKHQALVGALLGDGVEIVYDTPVHSAKICFSLRQAVKDSADTNTFTVLDIGYTGTDLKMVEPLGVEVSMEGDLYCGTVTNMQNDISYFPIARIENWENKARELYEKEAYGLLYTLSALFLLSSVIGFAILCYIFVLSLRAAFKIQQVLLVGFLLTFNVIRCVYFFLVTNGISSVVTDYILVVLPTFFYFSAFTQLVAAWGVISTADLTKLARNSQKIINLVALVLNLIMYATFIIIVLIFNFAHKPDHSLTCGRRFVSFATDHTQRNVYYAYAAIIAFFSLAIAVGFAYFGSKLAIQINQSAKVLNRKAGNQKTTYITIIGVIAFLLHCVFILIQAGLNNPVIIFNFIAIIITEIIPSIILFFSQVTLKAGPKKNVSSSTTDTETATMDTASSTTATGTSTGMSTYSHSSATEEDL